MCVFTHYVVRARLNTSPRRDSTSRSVNLFREMFQVVDKIVISSERFVSEMLRLRSLVPMHALILMRSYDHVVLNYLSIDSGLQRRCELGFPSSMHRASMLQA